MDFKQKKRLNKNEEKYHIENLKISREFSKLLLKEMGELVRSIVLFGSNTYDTSTKDSDIDIMIVLDNVSVFVTDELREAYRIITSNLAQNVGKDKLHIMTLNLSDLWDMSRKGDPVLINVLRYGMPIFDRNLVEPLQYLLEIGKIRPSREAVYNYMARSSTLMNEIDKHMQNSVLDIYYSVIDMVHATLMCSEEMPPSPKEMPEIFANKFKGKLLGKYSKDIKEFYDLAKKIEKGKLIEISGAQLDKYKEKAMRMISDLEKYNHEIISKKDIFEL